MPKFHISIKVRMYILSMIFVFISLSIYFSGIDNLFSIYNRSIDSCNSQGNGTFSCVFSFNTYKKSWKDLSFSYYRIFWFSFFLVISLWIYCWFYKSMKELKEKTFSHSCEVTDVSKESSQYLSFLATYIMPLSFIDASKPSNLIIVLMMIFVIGVLSIKNKTIHSNPTLSFFNLKSYKVSYVMKRDGKVIKSNNDLIVLSTDDISNGDEVVFLKDNEELTFIKKKGM
ncbi:anti-phage protein KwaA [Proteus mirabilis]|uniref:anti-phage protein KwaA n=1 Tax=Proteus mirabilis TaxID=584 RepID=UPI0034D76877